VGQPIQPGELVVRKLRWKVDANLMGIVIGHDAAEDERERSWLVLWTMGDRRVEFKWHLADALLVVDETNAAGLSGRGDVTL
jgi:hypothetical protein